MVLFEPSHLSLERFVKKYSETHADDIVRYWQDVKEKEYRRKKPVIVFSAMFVLMCLTAVV
jgi:hypothetical protein